MIYIENNSMDPFFNFALEYYIMHELALEDDVFMFWRTEPTLMIGRNQNTAEEINSAYVKEKNIHVVRRISGGGTIYTDPDGWQFSFIIRGKPRSEIDFKLFAKPVLDALNDMGVPAYFSNRNDLLIDGKKFSGNAQCSTSRCMLHHGSLLFNTDLEELVRSLTVADDKIISKGIKSVRQRVTNILEHMEKKIDTLEFKEIMLGYLLKNVDGTYELTPDDIKRVNEIADGKFRQWEWNYGESPKFEITKSNRFAGGKVEVNLNVDEGRIQDCKIYGDFFTYRDIDDICKALIGCAYREEDIRNALEKIHASDYFYLITLDELISCII
ncbi:MAG: lipoate--protein ligase [Bacillota bacterium]